MEELHPDVSSVILSEEDIKGVVTRLGAEISRDYAGKNPLVVAVLRGAFIFTADLMRSISVPCAVDFMAVSSYGDGVKSSGVVRIVKDLNTKIEGRDVIIAEDILDSGLTLSYLVKMLEGRGPNSVRIVAFAIKDIPGHTPAIQPDYVGTHVPNEFIVGYGLDYAERYRNLPYIGVLKPEVYTK
jgi:hypoxanthine phosphoribosyltransferase